LDNVALGLRIRGKPRPRCREEAEVWLGRLGLAGFVQRFPRQLSGGQRKRVALAQVLALKPRLLLMDEPFASLDAIVRLRVTQDLLALVEGEGISVLLVTHDLEEAQTLSDAIYLLSQGPCAEGNIWPHLQATFSAAIFGLVLGVLIGAILGIAAALTRGIAELLEPVMVLLNAIPRVVLAPLFVIWFGIGLASKVALAFILV